MKLSILTDGLTTNFEEMLDQVRDFGYEALELATGNWSDAPHVDLDALLSSENARSMFLDAIQRRDLYIAALNCSGNPLAPNETGKKHADVTEKTFRLAEKLGVSKVVCMSGLPGGCKGDRCANWIVASWPQENIDMRTYQWEIAVEYWTRTCSFAKECGVTRIALENHGHQLVYNADSLLKLRSIVGDSIGMNLDPSHVFWMGGDPIAMARRLEGAIYHLHAKDARVERQIAGYNTTLETRDISENGMRAWNYNAVGFGHDLAFWKEFVTVCRMMGYDDEISLEIEDVSMNALDVVRKSTQVLKQILPQYEMN